MAQLKSVITQNEELLDELISCIQSGEWMRAEKVRSEILERMSSSEAAPKCEV